MGLGDVYKRQVDTVLPQIPGSMPGLTALPSGCRFHPRCGDAMAECARIAPEFADGVACHKYSAVGSMKGKGASNGG